MSNELQSAIKENHAPLRDWNGRKISHAVAKLSGAKFDIERTTSRDFEPDEDVYFVVKGFVEAKGAYEKTEAGWVRTSSVTITEAYELNEDFAEELLDLGHAEVKAVLAKRGIRLESPAA